VENGKDHIHRHVSLAGLIVTLGIIYGDIGTSPLYVMKAIVGDLPINRDVVLGGISCIFWTLTLQTTVKYVILALRADNKGEGGIFSLYTLVKRTKVKWLIVPAIIGGSALLADGILTPSISVTSAVEGLQRLTPDIEQSTIVVIVIIILAVLFFFQQFGSKVIGKSFGPVMLIWFFMLGTLGVYQLLGNFEVLKAVNPYYAYKLLVQHPGGFWILGAVFLCTTGAEALYSDLGHCGRKNIRLTWIFVKVMLLLNYFGQGAWLLLHEGSTLSQHRGGNPFFAVMPDWFLITGIIVSTAAAVIASQALISAAFTLINEAIRLNFWPKVRLVYPTVLKGQLYIPSVNWLLFAGCVGIVLLFKESSNMEAAYGLTINFDMLMTSTLLVFFMIIKRYTRGFIFWFVITYFTIELSFLVANLSKVLHGGWVSLLLSVVLIAVMTIWWQARKIRNRYVEFTKLNDYVPVLVELSRDLSVPKYATHLVYLTSANIQDEIEQKVIYSILQKQPKRADIYWFVHVDVVDEPHKMEYKVNIIAPDDVIRMDFRLGFRVAPRINKMFRQVVQEMVKNHEVDIVSRYESLKEQNVIGDFRFVVLEKFLSYENELPFYEKLILDAYFLLKQISLDEEKAFGLDTSNVIVEKVPLVISPAKQYQLKRID